MPSNLAVLIKKILEEAKTIQYQQLHLVNKFERDPTTAELKI
jgi:hypothetical protein